ncbi:MAG: rhomboid family intramembrane serine protease [Actinomycetia bacterium]|nr:rhomboid family intramembrane serine protease [Actinomycetes bacterium]
MKSASVGFHCPQCLSAHGQRVLSPRDLVRTPVVTVGLIALNALVFLVDFAADSQSSPASSTLDLTSDGLLFGPLVADGEWWRVITSGFLHSSWFHLGSNLLMLWILGQTLEPTVGRIQFGGIYAASLVAGSVGVLLLDPRAPTLGASGAVFGILGALIVIVRGRGISLTESGLGPLLVINLIITFGAPRISVGGHLGGLAGGLVLGWVVLTLADAARAGRVDPKMATAASMAAPWLGAVGLFAAALALAQQL